MTVFLVVAGLLATIGHPVREELSTLDDAALQQRFAAQCGGATPAADCPALIAELELRLLAGLKELIRSGAPVDREVARAAAEADLPFLAELGVQLLSEKYTPADEGSLLIALDSRYPVVREAAARLAQEVKAPRALKLLQRRVSGHSRGYAPDSPPTEAELGARWYPAARFRPSMSGSTRVAFSTTEAPEKVIAFYGKGKKVLDLGALSERSAAQLEATMPSPEELERMTEALAQETDPAKITQAMQKLYGRMPQVDWTAGAVSMEGGMAARYVVLEEKKGALSRVVGVFRDPGLQETLILFPLALSVPSP